MPDPIDIIDGLEKFELLLETLPGLLLSLLLLGAVVGLLALPGLMADWKNKRRGG